MDNLEIIPHPIYVEAHTKELKKSLLLTQTQLKDFFNLFCIDGGRGFLPSSVKISPNFRENGYSGYQYTLSDDVYGEVRFAPLLIGGFVVLKKFKTKDESRTQFEIYDPKGSLLSVHSNENYEPLILLVGLHNSEIQCPILTHLYNYLAHQYKLTSEGKAQTHSIYSIEQILKNWKKSSYPLSVSALHKDPSFLYLRDKIFQIEADPVLTWEERQKIYRSIFEERKSILQTKKRTHSISFFKYALPLFYFDTLNYFKRFFMRPKSNLKGLSYKYTIGLFIWFISTIRSNIGYSIALALYGPFTFYFITQPLNPHAMWAVGKVRSAYLDSINKVSSLLPDYKDSLTIVAAATATSMTSDQTQQQSNPPPVFGKNYESVQPQTRNMLLSTDIKEVDSQDWNERMSHFKAMQIGYEGNMVFAARMGRLEQMETQLNFTLIVESSWQEIARYLNNIDLIKRTVPSVSTNPKLSAFFESEILRAEELRLYIWDKMYRYLVDHPYIVMDQTKDQTQKDYYFGYSFVLFNEMTKTLKQINPNLKLHTDYKKIRALSNEYGKLRNPNDSLFESLQKNSKLFSQPNQTDGKALREYMQRQWEILYLLQNKAQEASHFGLQAYVWSVRNAIWTMQSIFSAKNRELTLLFLSPHLSKKDALNEIKNDLNPLYETLFHQLVLEFTSLQPELTEKLPKDIEYIQRKKVIEDLKGYLVDRESILLKEEGTSSL